MQYHWNMVISEDYRANFELWAVILGFSYVKAIGFNLYNYKVLTLSISAHGPYVIIRIVMFIF